MRPLPLTLVVLLGCAPRPADHFDLHVSSDVPCAWVQAAASAWEARTPVTFDVHCETDEACSHDDCWSVGAVAADPPDYVGGDTTETGSPNRGTIVVTVHEEYPVQEIALLTHELGHAIGLRHVPAATHAVMVADLGWWRVNCDDVGQFYEVRGWSVPGGCVDPPGVP